MTDHIKFLVTCSSSAAIFASLMALMIGYMSVADLHSLQLEIMGDIDAFKIITDDLWKDVLRIQAKHGVLHPTIMHSLRKMKSSKKRPKRQANGPTCQCDPVNTCPPGPPGERGLSGIDGMPGTPGTAGTNGRDGISVIQQLNERGCQICPAGPRGLPGADGLPGMRGPRGPPGLEIFGEPSAGFPGLPGPDGDPGLIGDFGKEGPQGQPGADTFAGIGVPGRKGPIGPRGNSGGRGLPGIDADGFGRPGPPGPTGLSGQEGTSGNQGRDGERGDPGFPGRDGQYCPCPSRSFILTSSAQRSFNNRPILTLQQSKQAKTVEPREVLQNAKTSIFTNANKRSAAAFVKNFAENPLETNNIPYNFIETNDIIQSAKPQQEEEEEEKDDFQPSTIAEHNVLFQTANNQGSANNRDQQQSSSNRQQHTINPAPPLSAAAVDVIDNALHDSSEEEEEELVGDLAGEYVEIPISQTADKDGSTLTTVGVVVSTNETKWESPISDEEEVEEAEEEFVRGLEEEESIDVELSSKLGSPRLLITSSSLENQLSSNQDEGNSSIIQQQSEGGPQNEIEENTTTIPSTTSPNGNNPGSSGIHKDLIHRLDVDGENGQKNV